MTWIGVRDLEPGMVSASPVTSCEGRILVERGAVLDDRLLKILKSWGIQEIEVAGPEGPGLGAAPTPPPRPDLAAELAEAAERFSLHPEDQVLRILSDVVWQHIHRRSVRARGTS